MLRKYADGAVLVTNNLGPRQIRVVANSGQVDLAGDVVVAAGCDLTNYKRNPIVLADHDPSSPIGTAQVYVANGQLEALISFAPAGDSQRADECCRLAKSGVLSAVSVGINIVESEPIKQTNGWRFTKSVLLELSLVAVPCDPNALVIERSRKSGRVLSSANTASLAALAKCLEKSADAHTKAIELLEESARHRRDAARHAARIAQSAGADDDLDDDDGDDNSDQELSFRRAPDAGRALRLRQIQVAALGAGAGSDDDLQEAIQAEIRAYEEPLAADVAAIDRRMRAAGVEAVLRRHGARSATPANQARAPMSAHRRSELLAELDTASVGVPRAKPVGAMTPYEQAAYYREQLAARWRWPD